MTGKLSDFAIELNEAMDLCEAKAQAPLWAREIANGLRSRMSEEFPYRNARYFVPNGDRFEVRFRLLVDGRRELAYAVNDEICDAETFEARLAEHWPRMPDRVWAREIAEGLRDRIRRAPPWHGFLRDKVAKYVAPNGEVFTVRALRGCGPSVTLEHAINGEACDGREFEVRLACHFEGEGV